MNEQHDRSIITAIRRMAGTYNQDTIYLVTGKVIRVGENNCDVEAVTGKSTTKIEGVEYQATVADGVDIVPKLGSEVKVLYSTYTQPFIVQYSEVEKIYISADLVQFNDGQLGGMVKVISLVDRLNRIEQKVNSVINNLNSHTHSNGNNGAPTGSSLNPLSGSLTETQRGDIENTIITQ